jgi:hypothetical protein
MIYLEWRQSVVALHKSDKMETESKMQYQNQRNVKIFSLITFSAITPWDGRIYESDVSLESTSSYKVHHASVSILTLHTWRSDTWWLSETQCRACPSCPWSHREWNLVQESEIADPRRCAWNKFAIGDLKGSEVRRKPFCLPSSDSLRCVWERQFWFS